MQVHMMQKRIIYMYIYDNNVNIDSNIVILMDLNIERHFDLAQNAFLIDITFSEFDMMMAKLVC